LYLLGYADVQSVKFALLGACFMLVSCLAYSQTLKMEATYSSEELIDSSEELIAFQQTTPRYISEDRTLLFYLFPKQYQQN
jgi:hypothetical protein